VAATATNIRPPLKKLRGFRIEKRYFLVKPAIHRGESRFPGSFMDFAHVVRNERFVFRDLRDVLAKANEEKSGDALAGLAAESEQERVAAKWVLADLPLRVFLDQPVVDPETDEVSRLILGRHDAGAFRAIASLTVGELRERLLAADIDEPADWGFWRRALLPEMVAGVAKLMSNRDLVDVSSRVRNVSRCRNTLGERGVLGVRIQPNHPTDNIGGILASTVEGLLYGCGDAVIGVNPAIDAVETVSAILHSLDRLITRLRIPTQACCLAHVTTQMQCLQRGIPVDLVFQSVAGTEAANASFGVTLPLLGEAREMALEHRKGRDVEWAGDQVMYFETGQGSALSANAHHGVDQLTLEARAYGVAREFEPFLVNTVVGFIGPEYLYDERQIIRAGLEDHFMGKLLGLPMGCDVCYTNHAEADQNSADNLLVLLTAAGCNYFMGVPCADDVMLNYQSTSYHDAASMRRLFQLKPAPEFDRWLNENGLLNNRCPAIENSTAGRRLMTAAIEQLP
jgi:ethanolamine ammonia-lyase large subunit